MVAFHDISSSPAAESPVTADSEHTHPAASLNDNADLLAQTALQTSRLDNARRIGRGFLKPLIAIATAQYVIVTVLACLSAIVVAAEAGKAINAKLEPVIAALKRL